MKLTDIKGVGAKRADALEANGITTWEDVILTLPKRYIEHTLHSLDHVPKEHVTLQGTIITPVKLHFIRSNLSRLTFKVDVEGTTITVSVFNQRYLKRALNEGTEVVVHGNVDANYNMTAQKVYLKANFKEGIYPVYGFKNIPDKTFSSIVFNVFEQTQVTFSEWLPETLILKRELLSRHDALYLAHMPPSKDVLNQILKRFKYEELLIHQLKMIHLQQSASKGGKAKPITSKDCEYVLGQIPFQLTNAQLNGFKTIVSDLSENKRMTRILQGDTGSGKTVVALLAAWLVVLKGAQVALMAPTEILAKQHFHTFSQLLDESIKLALITKQTKRDETVLQSIKDGSASIVIGTHSLFSDDIIYDQLDLVITDEQHRFGVNQRKKLHEKNSRADVLYLSATPIPRTLAQSLYGGMDVSIIDEKPNQQSKVITRLVPMAQEHLLNKFIEGATRAKQQVFVVSPVIETSATIPQSVKRLKQAYQAAYPSLRTAVLHGKMDSETQEQIMADFQAKRYDVLVATTIVEVGVDFPDATVMIVYHAERMGLAQLHQLRGRVGRREKNGVCLLVYDDPEAKSRLKILEDTHDGFEIARADLNQRGHGDLFGTLQSGYLNFHYVDLQSDIDLIKQSASDAKMVADTVFDTDNYNRLKQYVFMTFEGQFDEHS